MKTKFGFTLIELLVIVAIIAIIALLIGIVLPLMAGGGQQYDYKVTVFNGDGTIRAEYISDIDPEKWRNRYDPTLDITDKNTGKTVEISGDYMIEKIEEIEEGFR